ncbi:hypothetical protein GCM10020229_76780 [Kitasatospora albolonga]
MAPRDACLPALVWRAPGVREDVEVGTGHHEPPGRPGVAIKILRVRSLAADPDVCMRLPALERSVLTPA